MQKFTGETTARDERCFFLLFFLLLFLSRTEFLKKSLLDFETDHFICTQLYKGDFITLFLF